MLRTTRMNEKNIGTRKCRSVEPVRSVGYCAGSDWIRIPSHPKQSSSRQLLRFTSTMTAAWHNGTETDRDTNTSESSLLRHVFGCVPKWARSLAALADGFKLHLPAASAGTSILRGRRPVGMTVHQSQPHGDDNQLSHLLIVIAQLI